MFESFCKACNLITDRIVFSQEIPLERLKIPIDFTVQHSRANGRIFTPTDYKQLLELLQRTKLRHLELTSLETIPDTPANLQIESVQLLRLSGSCTFKHSVRYVKSVLSCRSR